MKINPNKSKSIGEVIKEARLRLPPEILNAPYTIRGLTDQESTWKARLKRALPDKKQ